MPVASPREPVVYSEAVEGVLIRGVGRRITPALRAKLRALGLDLDQKPRPTYPRELWMRALRTTVEEVWPALSLEEGYRQLGQAAIHGIASTMMGKAIASMARLLGPARAIHRLGDGFKLTNNYIELKLEAVEEGRRYRAWLSDTYGHPGYMEGCFLAAMQIAGARNVAVKVIEASGDGATLEVSWI